MDPTLAPSIPAPGHACLLFRAGDFFVSMGANLGDAMAGPDDACPGDIYELEAGAVASRLRVTPDGRAVAEGSDLGHAGDPVALVARYALMAPDGDTVMLLLIDITGAGLHALPLSPMGRMVEYTLLKVEAAPAMARLADHLCLSFARGTMITLASGAQVAIEALRPGDRVLTRDHGAQALVWVGRATQRAVGAFAPVVITRGTLGNAGDLIVSQHHRMFLYQRTRAAGLPTAELLVQARHLVDNHAVFIREGGFVEYLSLAFERHEIIYAEGVPCESLMVNDATLSRLPPDLAAEVTARFPGLSQNQHFGTEAGRQALEAASLVPGPGRSRR